jgi:hypothetical protein
MTGEPETGLDFTKAEFEGKTSGVVECKSCLEPAKDTYFEVNGEVTCPDCRRKLDEVLREDGKARRIAGAVLLGTIGGVAGAAAWYAVLKFFDMQLGLLAIAVGWLVGTGVSKGSGERGGLGYQILAIFITYASIVTTYIPSIVEGLNAQAGNQVESVPDVQKGQTPADSTPPSPPASEASASSAPATMSMGEAIGALGLGILALYAIAFAAPFLMGFENIMGILFILIALHQAWTMNRKREFSIAGPFRVAFRRPDPPAKVEPEAQA